MTSRPSSAPQAGGVFDRPLHLAGVLDNAADELSRTWFGYEWNDRTRCNCGIVAAGPAHERGAVAQAPAADLCRWRFLRPTWRSMTEVCCSDTGLTQNEVFTQLFAAGLRVEDFPHLEDLSHPEIVARMTPYRRERSPVRRSRKSDVIAYLRGWAEGIEAHHDAPVRAKASALTA
ncbi:MAG: hypothetical protein WDO13_09695, partial [Verrucomicrobiota bacterium]